MLRLSTVLALVSMLISPAALAGEEAGSTLRTIARQQGIEIGSSVDEAALQNDTAYAALLASEFGSLTPENVMKFDSIHPEPSVYEFGGGDKVVEFAEAHGMKIHGHVLLWHEQLPEWLKAGTWTREQLCEVLHEHIGKVVGHYRGRVAIWDVASEVIDEEGKMRKTFWLDGIGPDYIELVFRWAHEADPEAQLLYNDYGGEGTGPKATAIFEMLAALRARGVPVHGVGLQMHVNTDDVPTVKTVRSNMKRMAGLGLKVHITEMDVGVKIPATPDKLAKQSIIYRDMMRTCLAEPACASFTMWGFTDRYSWIPEFFPGWGAALIFDEEMRAKPAYRALMDALSAHRGSASRPGVSGRRIAK